MESSSMGNMEPPKRLSVKLVLAIVLGVLVIVAAVIVLILALGKSDDADKKSAQNEMHCEEVSADVALSAEDSTTYALRGELCYEGELSGKTLQVLVAGFTYDRTVWDFPVEPGRYSYVQDVVGNGYATLAIDRLGTGRSERPSDPSLLTVPTQAYSVSQLVQQLRAGDIAGERFEKILGVGHSLGASLWIQSAEYGINIDGLILAASLHNANFPFIGATSGLIYPANQDPEFSHLDLPDAYVTTRPDSRSELFYNLDNSSQLVVFADEKTKAVGVGGELGTIFRFHEEPLAQQFGNIPVLIAVGELDNLFCDPTAEGLSCANAEALREREASSFSDQVCLDTFVLKDSGHDINQHYNAKDWFNKAVQWADSHVGNKSDETPPEPCQSS